MTSPLGTPELDAMHGYEDKCVALECSHWDGDMCTLGACLDPPEENFIDYCDRNGLDPEEEMFYERADHDIMLRLRREWWVVSSSIRRLITKHKGG